MATESASGIDAQPATASRVGAAFACGAIASQPAVGIAFWLQRPSDTTRGDAVA
jgi:hypothetical protein